MPENPIKIIIESVFSSQAAMVLASEKDHQPYTNLVAFSYSADLKHLYFATPRETTKYGNIMQNPNISMLIDARKNDSLSFGEGTAVTVVGKATELLGMEREKRLTAHAERLPGLGEFLGSPSIALFEIEVRTYVVARGLTDISVFDPQE